jgi:hypothetical protein
MEKIVLYCKSYRNDIDRVIRLVDSVKKFNTDNIAMYISVPKHDIKLFDSKLSKVNLIEDESVYTGNKPGWIQQQIVKSNFWKLGISENYVCIDSDSYFIRPFYISDFMFNNETPYTVMHEQKELFSWSSSRVSQLGFNPKDGFIEDRKKIMDVFDRSSRLYDFGPSPIIWSSKVWKSLEDNYSLPNGLSFENLLSYSHSEFSWYGESLLAFRAIDIYPIEPLFKVFHYPMQLIEYKNSNITEDMISENYMGIVLQSNFNAPINY